MNKIQVKTKLGSTKANLYVLSIQASVYALFLMICVLNIHTEQANHDVESLKVGEVFLGLAIQLSFMISLRASKRCVCTLKK